MCREKVMVMTSVWPDALKVLEAKFDLRRCDEVEDRIAFLKAQGKGCRAVITSGHDRLGEDELQYLPDLELVSCTSAGFDEIDFDALTRSGIPLTNTSEALKDQVADTALMLILAARGDLIRCDTYVRSQEWGRAGPYPLLHSLKGQRAGIIGLGAIGLEIAARLTPMKLEIGYCSRSPKNVAFPYFENPADLAEWADVLIVAVPSSAETDDMIDHEVLTKLGPNGTLINIARGSVVDEVALVACLTKGQIASAGLDVFKNEPNPNPELTGLPNVVLYPHQASGTIETRAAMAQLAVDNLVAHFEGHPLLTPVGVGNKSTRDAS
jgi:lactate dehydrogenase-like 2-hydroxyacid dehydrogenase